MSKVTIKPSMIKPYIVSVFERAGLSSEHSNIVSDNLLEAELRGVYSHGLAQVKRYTQSIQQGIYNTRPHIAVLNESPATGLVDGDFAMGAVTGTEAMQICIEKAGISGCAGIAVKRGCHFGMAAYYSMMALKQDMIGIAACNSGMIMSVYDGTSRVLGTNPISIAVPAKKRYPLVFDAATSHVAFNKIYVAGIEGRDIPVEWALDEEGRPTTDPIKALKGMVVPFGSYKGSGLAIMVNVLSAILSGAAISNDYDNSRQEAGHPEGVGYFFAALDIQRFQDVDKFKTDVDGMIDQLKSSRKKEGVDEIYMPGELEYICKRNSLQNGIALGLGTYNELVETGVKLGLNFDPAEWKL